jgi:hypothetical protein
MLSGKPNPDKPKPNRIQGCKVSSQKEGEVGCWDDTMQGYKKLSFAKPGSG